LEERVFVLERHSGKMLNPYDGSRNVSLKTETFATLFRDMFLDLLGEMGGHGKVFDAERLKTALYASGLGCGRRFAESVGPIWQRWAGGSPLSEAELVRKWCLFDSDVGFGKFNYDFEREEISLEHSFLDIEGESETAARVALLSITDDGERRRITELLKLSELMRGYIEGVLRVLVRDDLRVSFLDEKSDGHVSVFSFGESE